MVRMKSFLPAMAGAVLLSACGSGEYYERTPQQVVSSLRTAYLPTHVLGGSVAGSRVTQNADGQVVTALLDENSRELMRFVTTITPEGVGSRVSTEILPTEGSNKDRATKAMRKHGLAMGLMEGLAKEHVDAAIEGRSFDMMFANPMAKGMAGAMPGMKGKLDQANEAAMEFAKAEQDAARQSQYGDDWGGTQASESEGWGE